MDGIALLEAVKALDPAIEVIVVTAFGEMEMAIAALRRDASDFITKPVNHEALHLALGRAAERALARRRLAEYTASLERDIVDQARILHQDKMMSLGRLAASVLHEINIPLAGILNYARLMLKILERGPLNAADQKRFGEYLALVARETDRCSRIVSGLLAFSRKTAPRFEALDAAELIERCVKLSRHKLELSNIRLTVEIGVRLPLVYGDFNQLQQCIINLIFNAIDAMPQGGDLFIGAAGDAGTPHVAITVRDTGGGIEAAHRPHLFEPFFTTKEEGHGTGLGLSTVYGIMQRHAGQVHVESEPGKGATFVLELPTANTPRDPQSASL
jgi:signal transduction histidine kinase